MMTSCSPGWIKFVEQFYPDFIANLSTCKSPQQMLGAVIKSYFAEREGIDPAKIFSVSIMPCTAKKFEAGRPEMGRDGVADVDAVLTTRELAQLIRMRGLDLDALEPETADTPFGERTTAGKLFGATGGVMEAALRTAHFLLTGKELDDLKVEAVRGLDGRQGSHASRSAAWSSGVAVVSGLGNARKLLDQIRAGRKDLHFIEVMTCPGGCIAGGGQPLGADREAVRARMQALYNIDRDETVRVVAHATRRSQRLYEEFLGEPLGEKSHHLLHTHYARAGRDAVERQLDAQAPPRHRRWSRTIKERCRVCYTCVRECPAKAIRIADGQAEVIAERCIGCGNCVRVCSQQAKQVRSIDRRGRGAAGAPARTVAACVAPSFPAEFADIDYRAAGRHAAGAGVRPGARGRLRRRPGGPRVSPAAGRAPTASATSPPPARPSSATSSAIIPDLVGSLAPIVSPMVATARVAARSCTATT